MDGNAKQEVAEKLRSSSSVLVTVSNDPTVDQLSAALGLSLMLTKLGKHTTTVFSGKMPNTIEFLDPDKTFDTTVDGLRDFIISLDKDKADKLRYKVEDDVVKIFITPYKSKITDKDLNFTQGDFNVDLVVALGVRKRDDLDNAITSHGRILHDAAIVTINAAGDGDGNLGAVDWNDENASCLSEMLVSISEALEGGILDKQMSTAFLTGIVSATERFKNDKTTPKIMTMAAQLMAAGANQQLIASNLQIPSAKSEEKKDTGEQKADSTQDEKNGDDFAKEDHTVAIDRDKEEDKLREPAKKEKVELDDNDLLIDIEHAVKAKHNDLNDEGRTNKIDSEDPAIKKLETDLSQDSTSNLIDIEGQLKSFEPPKDQPQQDRDGPIGGVKSMSNTGSEPEAKPLMGGTFNATASEAHDRLEADKNRTINKEILSHNSTDLDQQASVHGKDVPRSADDMPTSADLMKDLEDARRAVEQAMDEAEFQEGGQPTDALNAAPMPLDESGGDMNLSQPQMNNGMNGQGPMPMNPPQMPQQNNFQPMPPQPMNNGQSPTPMNPSQIPQQPMGQPQQQMGNPMFNLPQQPQSPANGNNQAPPQPGQSVGPNGNGQMPPGGQSPPPSLPPNAPPPMPPFN